MENDVIILKTCSKCKQSKSIDFFTKDKNTKDGLRPSCKDCVAAYDKGRYEKNKRASHDKRNEQRKKQRVICKKLVLTHLKEHGCVDCGEKDPIVLEFDHVRGIKTNNICHMI